MTGPCQLRARGPRESESYIEITLSAETVRVPVDAAALDVVLECLGRRS
jgi:hypothetical protein